MQAELIVFELVVKASAVMKTVVAFSYQKPLGQFQDSYSAVKVILKDTKKYHLNACNNRHFLLRTNMSVFVMAFDVLIHWGRGMHICIG